MGKGEFKMFEELVLTVDKIGYEKTLEVIRNSRNLASDKETLLREFIISTVCFCFSVSKKELLSGKSTTERTNALAICSYELKKNIGCSLSSISFVLKKDSSVISRYIKRVNSLDENYKEDKILLDKQAQIRKKITEFRNNVINK